MNPDVISMILFFSNIYLITESQMKITNLNDDNVEKKSIDLAIKLILIALLLTWCAMILIPFVIPVLWGIILAITLYPLYNRLLKLLKGRKALSSSITTGVLLLLLIIPALLLISTVVESSNQFIASLRDNTLAIPPPKPSVADWPLIGEPVYNAWLGITSNLEAAIKQYSEQILKVGNKLLEVIRSVASNFLILIISIIISGILMTGADKSQKSANNFASRLFGKGGDEFITMIVLTIRNVAKGILGVAFIQFILLGAALIIAKVPFAGLWALAVLLIAIVQLPVGLVAIPIVIYLYSTREPLSATLWSVVIILIAMSDNVLKPWLMGKGAPVPTLVIFLGAIGGMIMSGFIGLFTGAIILSLGYKLAGMWLNGSSQETDEDVSDPE
jgi:predicted PurR-regulated permease PerM